MSIRIPYDAVVVSAVAAEIAAYVGGKVQGVRQPNDWNVYLGLYTEGREDLLLLSLHPVFARVHFVTRRPGNAPQPPAFCATLRARIDGARLTAVRQVAADRVLEMDFDGPKGPHRLVAEIMGKHSNLMLLDETGRIVSAAKWVNRSKSSRPVQPNTPYVYPPVLQEVAAPELPTPGDWVALAAQGNATPFFRRLVEVSEAIPAQWQPVISPGNGAYPLSVAPLGVPEFGRASISVALEQHYEVAIPADELAHLRATLTTQLERVLLARDVALADLRQTAEAGERAGKMQRQGELVLAYGPSVEPGAKSLQAWDYDGTEMTIKLDADLDYKANAQTYFDKAKKAKSRIGIVRDQIERISNDRETVAGFLAKVEREERLDRLRDLRDEARARRWLTQAPAPGKKPDERPYEGHRVRELVGPGGFLVLYGENAESNDYLTMRVAKPNDYWLHVRGSTSAHVVIQTRNHPEKINREHLEFAARVAVQNSPSKHSGYVPVDYTLKRHVRRPRGAPKGTALYTHEKTLHIEGK